MPKILRIFEQDGEVCVSLGKIEGQGVLVFLTEEERQKMLHDCWNNALEEAAKLLDVTDGELKGSKTINSVYAGQRIRDLKE